jgi:hypothetical protein
MPSALPLPAVPGITQLLALVVFTLIFQLLISKKTLWLPKKFLNKEISGNLVKKISGKLVGLHRKYGIFIKKRITLLFHYPFITIIYLFCCVLAFCVALPIPFSNTIPSIGLLIICFSIIEKDGLFMILGILIGLTGITLATYIYIFGIEALKAIFG